MAVEARIGDNSWVGVGADLYNLEPITIGSDVCISQQSYLCTGSHDRRSPTFEFDNAPIVVEDGAWLCARSMVLRGVTIGANSVVGAMALVTSDVPPDSLVHATRPTALGGVTMRILQVVTLLSPDGAYGGPARVAINQCRELIRRGHDAVLAAAHTYPVPPAEADGVPLRLFRARRVVPATGFAGIAAPGMLRWSRRALPRFDLVHVHLGRDLVTLPIAVAARRGQEPYVVQPHGMIGPSSHPLAAPLDMLWTKRAMTGAGAVFHLTAHEARDLAAVGGDSLRLVRLRNGVPSATARPQRVDPPEVVFAGRLHERKRPIAFVEIAKTLLAEGTEATFTLIGPDEGEGAAVRAAIGNDSRIRWIGAISPDDMSDRLAAASIYVLPAVREPYPMTVLEAMAVGTPVVVTNECGLADSVSRTGSGIVAPVDVPAVTAAVRTLLADPDQRIRAGERALDAARSEFGMAEIGDRLLDAYTRTLEVAA